MDDKIKYSSVTEEILIEISKFKTDIQMELERGRENTFSLVTEEVLNRIQEYKYNISIDRTINNSHDILVGISIVEEVIKEINPQELDDEFVKQLSLKSRKRLNNINYNNEVVNLSVCQGVEQCLSIVYIYNNVVKYKKKEKIKKLSK